MIFLCDEMLRHLGHWLRAAGYDTKIVDAGTPDPMVWQQARSERRLLITRDRKFLEYRDADDYLVYLQSNSLEENVCELGKHLSVNWLFQPFSRCLQCNTPVRPAPAEMLQRVPEESRKLANPLTYCPTCDKVYWQGGHVERMMRKLQGWQDQLSIHPTDTRE